jgi:hypothetical protein
VAESRRMRWVEHVARMEEVRNTYIISVRKPERVEISWKQQTQMKG